MTPRAPRAKRPLPSNSRKLLIAAMGVAAVSYIGCTKSDLSTSGNLMAGEGGPPDTGQFPTSGNLMAPDATVVDAADGSAPADASDAGDADSDADAS